MSLMNRLLAILILILSLSANATVSIKAIILKNDSVIESKDISAINFNERFDSVNSVELNDESVIDSSDIKSVILKNSNNAAKFHRINEMAAKSNGNGSGG
ncbi:MAG: hypothetical protein K2Q18_16035 [Bdellovibrionales bacterium]|nr:hypothetical protein [Bdellovibrionales bacterium]